MTELLKKTFTFLDQVLVLVFNVFLSTLELFDFFSRAELEEFKLLTKSIQVIIVFNVNNLFDLLRGSTSEFNEFFSECLIVLFQDLNSLSQNVEFLGVT